MDCLDRPKPRCEELGLSTAETPARLARGAGGWKALAGASRLKRRFAPGDYRIRRSPGRTASHRGF